MIEWIVAAAIVGLFGAGTAKRVSTSTPTKRQDFPAEVAKWRADWEPVVDRSRWIPKSMASRVVARFPPPKR